MIGCRRAYRFETIFDGRIQACQGELVFGSVLCQSGNREHIVGGQFIDQVSNACNITGFRRGVPSP